MPVLVLLSFGVGPTCKYASVICLSFVFPSHHLPPLGVFTYIKYNVQDDNDDLLQASNTTKCRETATFLALPELSAMIVRSQNRMIASLLPQTPKRQVGQR